MTERVRHLLETGADPESILICTFSTKAADELKDRLIDYALDENSTIQKTDINKMQISTVHSFCMTLLKVLGYNFDVYDDGYSEKRLLFVYKHKMN